MVEVDYSVCNSFSHSYHACFTPFHFDKDHKIIMYFGCCEVLKMFVWI